jgi:hypothetical protein
MIKKQCTYKVGMQNLSNAFGPARGIGSVEKKSPKILIAPLGAKDRV